MAHTIIAATAFLVLAWLAATLATAIRRRILHRSRSPLALPLPPGPPPVPILGNIRDLPPAGVREWEFWLQHKDKYGPISSVSVMGTTIVVVHDPDIANELLDKRGNKYSSRPWMTFGSELAGFGRGTAMLPQGHRNRAHRKYMHASVGSKAALAKHVPLQQTEAHRFLLRVLNQPSHLLEHIKSEAGAIILKIAYGYTLAPAGSDPVLDNINLSTEQFSVATVPGAWLVDTMPFLKYLPDFLPGTGFKKTGRIFKAQVERVVADPIMFVKSQMAIGDYYPSYVSDMYESLGADMTPVQEEDIAWSAMVMYSAGADTTASVLHMFFLNMMLHPEIQQRAREEIDRVIGTDRLPTIDDRDNLPYIEAITKEAFRWHPVTPMSIAHVVTEDDVFDKYLIPKGAMIVPNVWWFTHDPAVFPEPMVFNPDRWLVNNPPTDPRSYAFGFGRRICPGRLLADQSVFLTIAATLATLDITKPIDSIGREISPHVSFVPGLLSRVGPYDANIKARSKFHEDLIRRVEVTNPWTEGSYASMPEQARH